MMDFHMGIEHSLYIVVDIYCIQQVLTDPIN